MRRDHEEVMAELARAVGRRVHELRLARPAPESTLVSLARRTGMSVSFLSMIENGHRLPSLGALVSLSKALETAPANLLEVAGEPLPAETAAGGPAHDVPDDDPPSPAAAGESAPSATELLEPVAAFFRSRGLGEREVGELLEAARKLFS